MTQTLQPTRLFPFYSPHCTPHLSKVLFFVVVRYGRNKHWGGRSEVPWQPSINKTWQAAKAIQVCALQLAGRLKLERRNPPQRMLLSSRRTCKMLATLNTALRRSDHQGVCRRQASSPHPHACCCLCFQCRRTAPTWQRNSKHQGSCIDPQPLALPALTKLNGQLARTKADHSEAEAQHASHNTSNTAHQQCCISQTWG